LGLPKSLTGVFQGVLLFSLLACDTLIHYKIRVFRGKKPDAGGFIKKFAINSIADESSSALKKAV
jgi:ABC-type uncharacterized transport system permease subunit